jgi:hypothetical protein
MFNIVLRKIWISNTGVISFSGAGTGIYEQVFILPSSGGYFRRDGANVLNNVTLF